MVGGVLWDREPWGKEGFVAGWRAPFGTGVFEVAGGGVQQTLG